MVSEGDALKLFGSNKTKSPNGWLLIKLSLQKKFALSLVLKITVYGLLLLFTCENILKGTGAPNENIVQNHLNEALLNVF